ADLVPHAGVGGRVRARGTADRRLVDVHDLVQVLQPGDRAVPAWHHARAVQLVGQRRVEDVVDQAGLARSGHPRDGHEDAQREGDVDALEVVLAGTLDHQLATRGELAPLLRDLDGLAPGQVGP